MSGDAAGDEKNDGAKAAFHGTPSSPSVNVVMSPLALFNITVRAPSAAVGEAIAVNATPGVLVVLVIETRSAMAMSPEPRMVNCIEPLSPGPNRITRAVCPRWITSPVLNAEAGPVAGATARFCALGVGESAGVETFTSTPLAVCPAASVITAAVVVAGVALPLVGRGATRLPAGDAALPPQPTSNARRKKTAVDFTIVSSRTRRKDVRARLRSCHCGTLALVKSAHTWLNRENLMRCGSGAYASDC